MFIKLEEKDYERVIPLLESDNELSAASVISNIVSGNIYVNRLDNPTVALIKTSECNLIAGSIMDTDFNNSVKEVIGFWDSITPDSKLWNSIIPKIHPNKYIRKYTRRHYVLDIINWDYRTCVLPEGYYLENIDLEKIKKLDYENVDEILDWIGNWENEDMFNQFGVGVCIRNEKTIVSWSISDCAHCNKIAIGIHTDGNYRRRGFAEITVNEMIRQCSIKGYQQIEWLCVDINKGSIAIAEKMGFKLQNKYDSFISYAPVENWTDLSENEWAKWAEYFEEHAKSEPRLIKECIYTYIKANKPEKVNEMIRRYSVTDVELTSSEFKNSINGFIGYLQSFGMASVFEKDFMS